MISHNVVAGNTEGITVAQQLLSFAHIGPMVTLQVFRAIAEYAAVLVTLKDLLAQGSPIGAGIMGVILWH
jgi:hypothetical protein